ncbi:MAG: lipopolysaccharide heptosyltransferase II [Betaproteobacteria bacterium RIFCSPLOWO2_12_FULL_63_13]|nr:MAG: lipopolysaccharide heptosyltransferase II [Betaproteobacteria bacterium RIFCSPLOWO2_12_FULL_63_13]
MSRLPPRVLVVAPNWIGDTLLAQPLLARLQRKLPGVSIDVVAPAWTAPVLRRMPEVDEIIETPFQHGELKLGPRWRIGRSLRGRGYLEAIVLPNSFKAALIPFFADIPLRVGFVGELRFGLLNIVHTLDERKLPLMAERYAQLAEMPGEPMSRPLEASRLCVDLANLAQTLERIGLDRSKPVVVFCAGAEYGPAKRWPAEYFAELARRLEARGAAVWLIGSGGDNPIAEQIARESGGAALNLCGRTDLASAIDLMSVADLVVSNDSGLMHVAAALARPLVALYGSSSPAHTPPLDGSARIVRMEGLACSPCYERECPLGHFRCMKELTPERVLAEIDRVEAIGSSGS